jgi:hypothetical protein
MTASMSFSASSGTRISAEPAKPLVTRLFGQPMLMSMMSAPASAAISAPRRIHSASQPASCTTCGSLPDDFLSLRTISPCPVASALLAIISDTTQPAPNRSASRRMGASVMPAMGARNARPGNSWPPTLNFWAGSPTRDCIRNGQLEKLPAQ